MYSVALYTCSTPCLWPSGLSRWVSCIVRFELLLASEAEQFDEAEAFGVAQSCAD